MAVTPGSVRVLVETEAGGNEGELALRGTLDALGGVAAGERWQMERLFEADDGADRYFVVSVEPAQPLTPQQVFAVAYRLADQPGVRQAEPDLPVTAYWPDEEPAAAAAFPLAPPSREDLEWARRAIRCDEAWSLSPPAGGAPQGEGVRVGHPDTGYTRHFALGPELAALDLVSDHDFVDGGDDAEDPLTTSVIPLLRSPAHGTGTSSTIAGRGDPGTGVVGVAPRATMVPLRAVNSVVQFFDSDVARAVNHARLVGCHVVSMSLGGKGFFGLHEAIQRAVDSGMIVMAAAGNEVRIITAPASYDNCIAVAATRRDDSTWPDSSRGGKVEVSAPGGDVYAASWALKEEPKRAFVGRHSGTSYAVAHLAGAAALWLAHHGRPALLERYGPNSVAAAFRLVVRDHGHRRPANGTWDSSRYGVGILDAHALLSAPLPDPSEVRRQAAALAPPPPSGAGRLAGAFGELEVDDVEQRLARLPVPDDQLERFTPELLYHLLTDGRARHDFVDDRAAGPTAVAPQWVGRLAARASGPLADVMT